MIEEVKMKDGYSISVWNDAEKKESVLEVEGWQLSFSSKSEVESFINLLQRGMEFWEYDAPIAPPDAETE